LALFFLFFFFLVFEAGSFAAGSLTALAELEASAALLAALAWLDDASSLPWPSSWFAALLSQKLALRNA